MHTTQELRDLAAKGGPRALMDYAPYGFLYRKNTAPAAATEERPGTPAAERISTFVVADPDALVEPEALLVLGVRRRVEAAPDRITLGRTVKCDIVLPFQQVSKLHAEFVLEGATLSGIVDLGSSNGTFLNDRRLTRGDLAPLSHGDRLAFGTIAVRFVPATLVYGVLRGVR